MALNIKNERVCALAREVADRTGTTQTSAIETALEARLRELLEQTETEQLRREADRRERRHRIDELLAKIPPRDPDAPSMGEIMDELYEPETGLPR
ncbi:MAG: type II toxin-antitoxin system VapB family antitoxin [Actinomycetia bacterium]|nr:type II toxin-antitoxin system VapB family antitoxin [Actinomycetes bacterium]